MKKNVLRFYIALAVTVSGAQFSHAQYVVFDPTAEQTRLLQYARDLITSAAAVATQANTYFTYLQQSVLDPLANALIIATQIQQAANTINLITGSLNGNSLLIQNPEQWINKQGLNSVKINIGTIANQNGTYSASLLGNIISNYRNGSNLEAQLRSLSQSSIPTMVQNNFCRDANLSNIARNDVMRADGTVDLEAFQNRKQDLFNSLCVGNPTTNITLGKRLEEVGRQRPDVLGLDGILAVSFGDNAYNRSLQAQLAVEKDAEAKRKAAEDDLNRGGGIASKTNCAPGNQAQYNQNGEAYLSYDAVPCVVTNITNTGNALNGAFQEAINAPLKKLMEAFGPGAGQSIASILSLVSSARQISNAFDSTPSGTTSLPPTNDLTNPVQREQSADSVRGPLNQHLASLSTLERAENDLLSALTGYESDVDGIRACFEKLTEDYTTLSGDSRITTAYEYVNSTKSAIASMRAAATKSITDIATARSLVNETLTFMSNSSSTQAMLTRFTEHQREINTRGLPSLTSAPRRQSDIVEFNGRISMERSSTGRITNLNTQCAQIRQSYSNANGY